MTAPAIPAVSLPGALRQGTVVRFCGSQWTVAALYNEEPDEAGRDGILRTIICNAHERDDVPADVLALDLSDATTRFHVRIWLALWVVGDKSGEYLDDIEQAAFQPFYIDATVDRGDGSTHDRSVCGWYLQTGAGHHHQWAATDERTDPLADPERDHETPLPALNDLDPGEHPTLPDGSRLVDALALGAVALEVAKAAATPERGGNSDNDAGTGTDKDVTP